MVDDRYGDEDGVAARLHSTTDAQVWAREWCRIAREIEDASDGREVIDEGWMIGWFANAIEVGRNAGRRSVDEDFRQVQERWEEAMRDGRPA